MATRARRPQRLPQFSPFTALNRSLSQIVAGVRTFYFDVVIEATVTLAGGPATAIINGGSLVSLFDRIGINENGRDVADWPATMMHALTQRIRASTIGDVNLTLLADGVYNLRSIVRIPMKWPWGVAAETAYIEADPTQNTFLFLTPRSNLATAANFLVTTGGTAVITNLSVTPYQSYDDAAILSPPFFVPQFRTLNQAVASAGADVPFFLRTVQLLRGIMLETTNTVGGVANRLAPGIVTALRMKDDLRTYIGDPLVNPLHLQLMETLSYGGDVIFAQADNFIDFQEWGMLSKVYNPARAGNNLRFEITQAIPGGSSANMAFAGLIELVRIDGRTKPGLPRGMEGV